MGFIILISMQTLTLFSNLNLRLDNLPIMLVGWSALIWLLEY